MGTGREAPGPCGGAVTSLLLEIKVSSGKLNAVNSINSK